MFLSVLNQKEKENFIELAHYIATCDADFSPKEKNLINHYSKEMNLENYKVKNKKLDEILKDFANSSFVSKTSILLEILELMLSDATYHIKEKEVVKRLCDEWKISDEQFENIIFWLKDKNHIINS